MNPERWTQIKELYESALECEPNRRDAFLQEACAGDESLLREVQSLLARQSEGEELFASPALDVAARALAEEKAIAPQPDLVGRSLLHYFILERIGHGGMGEVYRAQDTHLDRSVAIKVLPPYAVADAERKRRFVQEAKAASSLNHPNIVQIYDINSDSGKDFIAMEHVAGKTLDRCIESKGLPVSEALNYGVQIADALAAAHAAGIVHRDIKPANIMVTKSGLIKVLDFGLAKLTQPVQGDKLGSTSLMESMTGEGRILGTVAYMSPEQAEGKSVDARSDIFSFGSVLYEMLSGQRAFQGDSNISTLSAILTKEPSPLSAAIPIEITKIISRCLRKNPERRFQHMKDLKVELEELKEEYDFRRSSSMPVHGKRERLPQWFLITIVALLMAAVAGAAWWVTRSLRPATVPVLTRLTSDPGLTTNPALSPDSKLLAYASDRAGEGNLDIWVQQIGGGEPMRLTRNPADEYEPAFSPDGTMIAFRSEHERGAIYLISTLGGVARKIAEEGRRPQFSPNGRWIAYWIGHVGGMALTRGGSRCYVVPSSGGVPQQIQPGFSGAAYPVWMPDGSRILFLGNLDDALPEAESVDWWVSPLEAGPAMRTGCLTTTRTHKLLGFLVRYPGALVTPTWVPDGRSVVFSARSGDSTNLWRLPLSPKALQVLGSPERLTSGTTLEEHPTVAFSPAGLRVAFASLNENIDIWSLPIDANNGKAKGELQRLTQDTAADFLPALSADGRRMVFLSGQPNSQEVWIKDLGSGEQHALTFMRSNKFGPTFSPDGSRVGYGNMANDKWDFCLVPASGGAVETVCRGCGIIKSWTMDGKFGFLGDKDGRFRRIELDSVRFTEWLAHPTYRLYNPRLSPDERWLAFTAASTGRSRIYVAPFRAEGQIPEDHWIAVTDGQTFDDKPCWSPDGNLLYHTSDRDGFRCIWAQRLHPATKQPLGMPLAVYHSHSARRSLRNMENALLDISVAADRMVFSMGERAGNIWMAEF